MTPARTPLNVEDSVALAAQFALWDALPREEVDDSSDSSATLGFDVGLTLDGSGGRPRASFIPEGQGAKQHDTHAANRVCGI